MTFFLWAEWQCEKCKGIHRARFDVILGWKGRTSLHIVQGFTKEDITVIDVAISQVTKPSRCKPSGSKIYCGYSDSIPKIAGVLEEYIEAYYSVVNGTLTTEVCNG